METQSVYKPSQTLLEKAAKDTVGIEMSNEAYHSLPGVSNSKLKDFMIDPRLYYHKYISGEYKRESKSCFDFGSAVHDIALLGTDANIVVIPDSVLAKNGARSGNAWKEFEEENAGKYMLKQYEFDAVMRCVDAIYRHPVASRLLRMPGWSERVFGYDDADLGCNLHCKVDRIALTDHGPIVVDLKTTSSGTQPEKFVKSIANFGYHYQEYFYRKVLSRCGTTIKSFVFVAVSVDEPHTVDCYTIDDEFLQLANLDIEPALFALTERTHANDWNSATHNSIVELAPPSYLKFKGQYQL